MKTLIVLFNLKEGVDAGVYETWARERDLATVRRLPSIQSFDVLRAAGIFGAPDATPPYRYVEVLQVRDMDALIGDVSTPEMQQIVSEFQTFADAPVYLVCDSL